jgi:DNA (cytosine-5)-methyltransferase 1
MTETAIHAPGTGPASGHGLQAALGRAPPDVALNHDPVALAVHKANHPGIGALLPGHSFRSSPTT